MSYIRIFVTLKITDNVARSAFHAIQSRMGYQQVSQIQRTEFWELAMPNTPEIQSMEFSGRVVTTTSLFMNPNKHRYRIESYDSSIQNGFSIPSQTEWNASALVCDRLDGKADSALQALHRISGSPDMPQALIHGIWWDFQIAESETGGPKKIVEELAVTQSRNQGLFANPHYQTCQIFTA